MEKARNRNFEVRSKHSSIWNAELLLLSLNREECGRQSLIKVGCSLFVLEIPEFMGKNQQKKSLQKIVPEAVFQSGAKMAVVLQHVSALKWGYVFLRFFLHGVFTEGWCFTNGDALYRRSKVGLPVKRTPSQWELDPPNRPSWLE